MSEVVASATGDEIPSPLGPDEESPLDEAAEFKRKVDKLVSMMEEDPKIRDAIIAETYVNIANIETYVRSVAMIVQTEGIGGMLRGFKKRGRQ